MKWDIKIFKPLHTPDNNPDNENFYVEFPVCRQAGI